MTPVPSNPLQSPPIPHQSPPKHGSNHLPIPSNIFTDFAFGDGVLDIKTEQSGSPAPGNVALDARNEAFKNVLSEGT